MAKCEALTGSAVKGLTVALCLQVAAKMCHYEICNFSKITECFRYDVADCGSAKAILCIPVLAIYVLLNEIS